MKSPIITNATKNAQLPESVEAGKAITIQLAPEGRYPQIIDDDSADGGQREVVQILDRQAMDALVANFEKSRADAEAKGQKFGVLVDADHSSETSTNTAAMGWVTKLYIDPEKGLMAEIEPTPLGAEKINGKVYRFVSGAWTLDDDNRPVELVSIGLTNKPNLPVAPMTNAAKTAKNDASGTPPTGEGVTKKDDAAQAKKPEDANRKPETPTDISAKENSNHQKGIVNMDIKEKLGLPPEATDAEVDGAIDELIAKAAHFEGVKNALNSADEPDDAIVEGVTELVNMCGELSAKNEEAEQARLNAEAEQLVTDNEDVLPDEIREEIKEEYIEDPEKAQATVANYRRIYERAVLNASRAHVETPQRKPTVFKNAEARRPAVGIAGIVASCNGDPTAINAAILKMCRH